MCARRISLVARMPAQHCGCPAPPCSPGSDTYRYEEDFDPLVFSVHGGDADAFLTGFIDLHLGPQLRVEDQTQAALGSHY